MTRIAVRQMEKNDRQNKNKGVESYMIRQQMSMTGYIKGNRWKGD